MDQIGLQVRAREFIDKEHIKCKLIHPESIELIWDEVEPHIARCTPHSEGELDTDDFFDYLVNAEMQLWVAVDKKIMAILQSDPTFIEEIVSFALSLIAVCFTN